MNDNISNRPRSVPSRPAGKRSECTATGRRGERVRVRGGSEPASIFNVSRGILAPLTPFPGSPAKPGGEGSKKGRRYFRTASYPDMLFAWHIVRPFR